MTANLKTFDDVLAEKNLVAIHAKLVRERDRAGDSGPCCSYKDRLLLENIVGVRPMAGFEHQAGGWGVTKIEEILEDTPKYMRFRTQNNSIYEWFLLETPAKDPNNGGPPPGSRFLY